MAQNLEWAFVWDIGVRDRWLIVVRNMIRWNNCFLFFNETWMCWLENEYWGVRKNKVCQYNLWSQFLQWICFFYSQMQDLRVGIWERATVSPTYEGHSQAWRDALCLPGMFLPSPLGIFSHFVPMLTTKIHSWALLDTYHTCSVSVLETLKRCRRNSNSFCIQEYF